MFIKRKTLQILASHLFFISKSYVKKKIGEQICKFKSKNSKNSASNKQYIHCDSA